MTAAGERVRVLVVDDSPESRAAIGDAVRHAGEFELVAAVGSGEEALEVLPRLEPELILLDIRMTGLDGIETTRLIRTRGSRAVVVLVSALRGPDLPVGADSCGADAILHKGEVSPRRLVSLWSGLQPQRDTALGGPAGMGVKRLASRPELTRS